MKLTRILFAKKAPKLYAGRGEEFQYWKKHVFREKGSVRGPEVYRPLIGYRKITEHNWYYDHNQPNTAASKQLQVQGKMPLVKPIKEWFIFLGDRVEVMVGHDKGKIGEVVEIVKERNWCFVESLHLEQYELGFPGLPGEEHLRRQQRFITREKPLLVTHEVKLVDPSDQRATDFEWRYTEDGQRVRVSARSGRIIPILNKHKQTWEDNVHATSRKPTDKDTTNANLKKVTFKPKMKTFEQDILDNMGIKMPPRKKRSYWY